MGTAPMGTVAMEKSDFFFTLVRLYQLMQDANLLTDEGMFFESEDEEVEGFDADEVDSALAPPTVFADFLSEHDVLIEKVANNYANEFANLFAVLAAPLLADPALKAEFVHYAMETFGTDVIFEPVAPERPKLKLVVADTPPLPPDPDAPKVP